MEIQENFDDFTKEMNFLYISLHPLNCLAVPKKLLCQIVMRVPFTDRTMSK